MSQQIWGNKPAYLSEISESTSLKKLLRFQQKKMLHLLKTIPKGFLLRNQNIKFYSQSKYSERN